MITLPCLIIVALSAVLAQLSYSNSLVNAAGQIDRYWSGLTGDHLIPPVNTDAHGYVGLKYQDDLSRFVFTVNAQNIGNVTGIYVYKGDKNQNGTMVLDLMKGERDLKFDKRIINVTSKGKLTGTLAAGGATKDNLQGELKGKPLSDFSTNSFVPMDDLFPKDSEIKWDKAGNKQ